jgi:hypothetical protein
MNKYIKSAEVFTNLMENKFRIGPFKFGFDAVIGLIPGGGDTVTAILALYLVWVGVQIDLPREQLMKILSNILLDFLIGLVPILGDLGDFVFKSNVKNLEILKQHSEGY